MHKSAVTTLQTQGTHLYGKKGVTILTDVNLVR